MDGYNLPSSSSFGYYGGGTGGTEYDDTQNAAGYYPPNSSYNFYNQSGQHPPPMQEYTAEMGYDPTYYAATQDMDDYATTTAAAVAEEGSYYPTLPPYIPHIQSSPISAIAIDPSSDAVYIAGHAMSLPRKRYHPSHVYSSSSSTAFDQSGGGGGGGECMVATHLFSNGSLYSACAAHAQARRDVLESVTTSIFGNSFQTSGTSSISTNPQHLKIPSHAYRPPYENPFLNNRILGGGAGGGFVPPKYTFHLGITKVLPFTCKVPSYHHDPTTYEEEAEMKRINGYYCSISPSSVRVHSRGGLQVSSSKIQGMYTGTFHPGVHYHHSDETAANDMDVSSSVTHVTVGGVARNRSGVNLYCMDLYSNSLKVVASHAVKHINGSGSGLTTEMCIADLATNHETANIIAGCSDGTIRILDGRWRGGNYMECARAKAHGGGVVHVATAGNLVCTTGFSSKGGPAVHSSTAGGGGSSRLYAFPDEHVSVFDLRYLGRGGIPHPFCGLKGGPRFVSFIPGLDDMAEHRILACSGQAGGGLQVITPFDSLTGAASGVDDFINPPLDIAEAVTAMSCVGKKLAIGTNSGNVMHYCLSGYENILARRGMRKDGGSTTKEEALVLPSTFVNPPDLSITPHLLKGDVSYDAPSIAVASSYVLCNDPMITPTFVNGKWNPYSFGPLSLNVCRPQGKRILKESLKRIVHDAKGTDSLVTVQTSSLGLNLLDNKSSLGSGREVMNANKLIYGKAFKEVCYDDSDPRQKDRKDNSKDGAETDIPERYRVKDKQSNTMFTMFDYAALNDTLFPGYDYPPTMSNSYVCPVLLLLYFIPEIYNAMLDLQQRAVACETNGKKNSKNATLLSSELGFLFHQINSISAHAMCHPYPPGASDDPCRPIVGTFIPSIFLSAFVTMQEAVSLALLDDSPAAAEVARRPEAFYRFLLHHLDRELSTSHESNSTHENNQFKLIDSLQGLDSVSMNEFITGAGPPSANLNRTYTVELSYESFLNSPDQEMPEFMQILQYSLSKHVRLRAWCEATKQFETVVQRKIIASLPNILSLSCACAGIHAEEKLNFWRTSKADESSSWLPELIEVEIDERGNVITRQLSKKKGGQEHVWDEYRGKPLPDGVVKTMQKTLKNRILTRPICCRYRLDIVLTYLNDSVNEGSEQNCGRHIVHTRIPGSYKRKILSEQLVNLKDCLHNAEEIGKLTLLRGVKEQDFKKRIQYVEDQIKELDARNDEISDDWVLFNGPNVSSTTVEDALAFHVPFKEPCILVYRKVDFETDIVPEPNVDIPDSLWTNTPLQPQIPQKGDTIAFDAEFVQVENEASVLTATGSRIVTREGRNAIGRISLLDSNSGKELVDDYVIPREPVVDYLTRFSGITPSDLNPKTSKNHLISARKAYLKMRYLVDRGCKFVGHGLRQDFLTVSIFVPPCQIIDTVDIYRLDNRRYISLRFLVNFLLRRDMQVEVHDSIEDSRAANELYRKALELKQNGKFDETLRMIYEIGQKIDWKVAELKSEVA
mmetsp:Transcript_2153/g.3958  ORF Transcript_2153/g.3958 Transcript_2153/m.3958 type:complete len:1509 (+) Transcript_2153:268-4794(+)|eukprot:CAMPEP_0176484618 /NCGR_PEP_ID=MMETSP0200_2-20121128/4554_1 /TAXON_ID=947934 /ORGANISM="Chaetoceros sp., Strain GSL56" /LENGTH=1508 /DNA_ID=CAMNT_0017881111 /DNA_START=224 /DNA_END=4750 /DNA_ORIENTATION=+